MLIVSTSVNLQNPAKRFYTMLEPKLMNGIESLCECGAKMEIAFLHKIRDSS
ncbi:hypothetical protein [Ructibacterium gallinarum]|uniref:Uncharacterized protein n=1 Tax=Ructibacterium gallinarum TaxID=2779355 RepID=A0A9D5R7T0_9FIRM|nr:hypothetical protein [Ructibacterium gallinarum]MBE5039566.1 hypothetical protein [Ructibacterium gallinarum]